MSAFVLLALLAQTPATPKPPLDVVVMVDVSNSVAFGTLPRDGAIVHDAGAALALSVEPGDSARIGTIANTVVLDGPRLHDPVKIQAAADVLGQRFGGASPIWDALDAAALALEDSAGRPGIVIVTDGRSTANRIGFAEMLDKLQRTRIPVFVVLLDRMERPQPDAAARLAKLAEATGGTCLSVERRAMAGAIARAVNGLRGPVVTATAR